MHPKEIFTLASKRSCFRTPFVNQRVNGFEALPNLAPHHYFSIFPGIRDKLSWKKCALFISEIFRLFVNTFVDSRWQVFPSQYADFLTTTSHVFISKRKDFLSIFDSISEMCMKFTTFWKTRSVSQFDYRRYYCIRKRCLVKRLKGLASADHSVINVLMGSKHCWSQHGTTIFLFFHNFQINWIGKSLP